MRRLLRGTFKLAVIAGIIGILVTAARKLMGGLGPEPGSADAPKEWPSLVPEPDPTSAPATTADEVADPATAVSANGQVSPAETAGSEHPAEDVPEP